MGKILSTTEPRVSILTWKEARELILPVNKSLVEQIDRLDPSDDFKLIKATYRYGEAVTKDGKFYLPEDSSANQKRIDKAYQLLQSPTTMPLGVILNKMAELDLLVDDRALPFGLIKPGDIFALWRCLSTKDTAHTGRVWHVTAGARSIAMLPKISDVTSFQKVQDKYGLIKAKPNNFLEQLDIFSELNQKVSGSWDMDFLYFSNKWLEKLDDPSWALFRGYLFETGWRNTNYLREKLIFNVDYSRVLLKRNLKPSPYLLDTVNHLYFIAAGYYPGFKFASDDEFAPVSQLQEIFAETYGLKYSPSVILPSYINHEDFTAPVYYSLHWPTLLEFSPSSHKLSTKLATLREIKRTLDITLDEILTNHFGLDSSIIYRLIHNMDFRFYHCDAAGGGGELENTANIAELDSALINEQKKFMSPFCTSSALIRGCVRISAKNNQL